jgi:hypothetical protein
METKIFVRSTRRHPDTGHITVRLQSETTHDGATWCGPLKDYGFDHETFYGRFGGDIGQLTNYLVSEHRTMIGRSEELVEALTKLEGQQIG